MSVIIGVCEGNEDLLGMSNGGMAVFLSALVLSGSRIAQTQKEKELILWFAEHDDTVRGRGCNGFDVYDIPWSVEHFENEMEFIRKVVRGAQEKSGWETLNYVPPDEYILTYLDSFTRLLSQFDKSRVNPEGYSRWIADSQDPRYVHPEPGAKCEKHGALLYWNGCIVCNDE